MTLVEPHGTPRNLFHSQLSLHDRGSLRTEPYLGTGAIYALLLRDLIAVNGLHSATSRFSPSAPAILHGRGNCRQRATINKRPLAALFHVGEHGNQNQPIQTTDATQNAISASAIKNCVRPIFMSAAVSLSSIGKSNVRSEQRRQVSGQVQRFQDWPRGESLPVRDALPLLSARRAGSPIQFCNAYRGTSSWGVNTGKLALSKSKSRDAFCQAGTKLSLRQIGLYLQGGIGLTRQRHTLPRSAEKTNARASDGLQASSICRRPLLSRSSGKCLNAGGEA